MTETRVGPIMYGYMSATFGAARVRREHDVATLTTRGQGRPEQIDFAIGRKSRDSGQFAATTIVEFAVRRESHRQGADPIVNLPEITKLVRAEATNRILLLLDLTSDDAGEKIVDKYKNRGYGKGRPVGQVNDRICIVYVGEHGTHKANLKRQYLKPKKKGTKRA